MLRSLISLTVLALVLPLTPVVAQAPSAAPLHIVIAHSQTPISDVLTTLSRQSGVPILADDTVVDTLGVSDIQKPTVPEMLDAITAMAPAETWQRVTIPADAPLPAANTLSAEVRDLQALLASRVTITNPGANTTVSYSRTPGDTAKIGDTTDRVVYLVTNETVRAQRIADKKAADAKNVPDTPLKQVNSSMRAVLNSFDLMTPAEQMQGFQSFAMSMSQIMSHLDPSVKNDLLNQAAQFKASIANGQFPPTPIQVPLNPSPGQ